MSVLNSMTPIRKTVVIGTAVLATVAVASWMLVLSPRADAVTAANEQVTLAAAANDQLRSTIATRRLQEAQLPDLRKTAKALDGRFPPNAQQPELFKMVTAAAGQAGLAPTAVTNLTVAPPESGTTGGATSARLPGVGAPVGEIASQLITMDVKGTPEQVRSLVANLEQLPRALQNTQISFSNSTAEDQAEGQTATITGKMYVLPAFPDPTLKKAAKKSSAKTSTAKTSTAKTSTATKK